VRILRVADVPDSRTGGMTRFMHLAGDELVASGHPVGFLFRDDLDRRTPPRLRRVVVPWRVVQRVRGLAARGERYDVAEVHEPIAAGYVLARRLDPTLPPCVVVSYGLEGRGHVAQLAYLWANGDRVTLKQRFGHSPVIAQAALAVRLADHVTVETTEDVAYLRRRHGLPADRITIVNGGVSQAFLTAGPLPADARGVLFLASWIDRKGIREAVTAMTAVADRFPDLPLTVAGCGVGEGVVRAAFPPAVRGRVCVRPVIYGETDLLALYRRHAVFLTPSVFEGQLLTMLEGAAAGLAVVATDTCGMRDFLRHGVTGLKVPVGDAAALTAATLRLVAEPAAARRLGEAAQVDARQYTWKRSAEQFLTAAEAAIRHARRRHR
jgi:glycosyltransferase involved in cell wall biosynthesis